MKKLLIGVLLGLGLALAAAGVHVVRDSGGAFLVPKETWTLEHSYIDARGFGVGEFLGLPGPVQKELTRRKAEAVRGQVEKTLEGLKEPGRTELR